MWMELGDRNKSQVGKAEEAVCKLDLIAPDVLRKLLELTHDPETLETFTYPRQRSV